MTAAMRFRAAAPAAFERRDDARYAVDVKRATVSQHGDQPSAAALIDISAYGCRLAATLVPDPGERLWLRFAGRPAIAATLVWQEGEALGCRFDEPLAATFVRALTLHLI
ncbi:MAG: PilZ domain-containing protein [Sphingomonas bacterium]|nr:PilZ domain-containing protein [Sphingomonas bacterium]